MNVAADAEGGWEDGSNGGGEKGGRGKVEEEVSVVGVSSVMHVWSSATDGAGATASSASGTGSELDEASG